jgi:hypothetical protein
MLLMIILLVVFVLWTTAVGLFSFRLGGKAKLADVRHIVVQLEQSVKDYRVEIDTKRYQAIGLDFGQAHDAAMHAEVDGYLSAEEEADVKLRGI